MKKTFAFLGLATLALAACAHKTEMNASTSNAECREALEHEQDWDKLESSIPAKDRIGQEYREYSVRQICEYYRFRSEPQKFCAGWSESTWGACLTGRLERAIEKKEASPAYAILLEAKLVGDVLKSRKEKSSDERRHDQVTPSFQMVEYNLYYLENQTRLTNPESFLSPKTDEERATLQKIQEVESQAKDRMKKKFTATLVRLFRALGELKDLDPQQKSALEAFQKRFIPFAPPAIRERTS